MPSPWLSGVRRNLVAAVHAHPAGLSDIDDKVGAQRGKESPALTHHAGRAAGDVCERRARSVAHNMSWFSTNRRIRTRIFASANTLLLLKGRAQCPIFMLFQILFLRLVLPTAIPVLRRPNCHRASAAAVTAAGRRPATAAVGSAAARTAAVVVAAAARTAVEVVPRAAVEKSPTNRCYSCYRGYCNCCPGCCNCLPREPR